MLGVIRMNDCVDERLPDCDQRDGPTLLPAQARDDRFVGQVLARKAMASSAARGSKERISAESIRRASVAARKTARLNPCIGKPGKPVLAQKEQAADRRDLTALVLRGHPQRAPRFGGQLPVRPKELGSSSELDGFRLQVRDGLLDVRVGGGCDRAAGDRLLGFDRILNGSREALGFGYLAPWDAGWLMTKLLVPLSAAGV